MMKNFLLNILKFIIFLIPIFLGLFIVWSIYPALRNGSNIRYVKEKTSFLRGQEVKSVKNIDILFIGSSLCYRGFDTRIFKQFGYKTFNLGTSSQTPIQTKVLLKQYIQELNPKLIIYAIDPIVTSLKDGVESASDIISNQYLSDAMNLKLAFEVNDIKLYNTILYRYLQQTIQFKAASVLNDSTDNYIAGGFVEKQVTYFKPLKKNIIHYSFEKKQLEALKEIVELFKERKQPYFFVYPPITKINYESILNADIFVNSVKNLGIFYNFNEYLSLNDSLHFYDEYHLNQHGVEIYNHELLKKLKPTIDSLLFQN